MRRVRSTLRDGGAPILLIAGVNLFLVLCLCVLLTNHLVPRYGVTVRPAESHFVMDGYDRSLVHIVSVAPGDEPRIYVGSELLPGGISAFRLQLDEWKKQAKNPSEVTVVLVVDEAVSAGAVQQLTDMVLCCGFVCSYSAVPALN